MQAAMEKPIASILLSLLALRGYSLIQINVNATTCKNYETT
jgi:hypothetical protein